MTTGIHARYIRYRDFDLFRYSDNFLAFLEQQAERLQDSAGTTQTFTADAGADSLTATAHGYTTGDPVRLTTTDTLPAGLAVDTTYFVEVSDANTVLLHATREDALAGATPIDITDAGTGTHSIQLSADSFAIFEAMSLGKSADEIRGITDVDNL